MDKNCWWGCQAAVFPRGKIKMGVTEVNSEQGLQGVKASSKDAMNSARSRTRGYVCRARGSCLACSKRSSKGIKWGGGQR